MANVEQLKLNGSKKRPIKRSVTNKHFLRFGVFLRKFSAYTSLHGFIYIAEEERSLAEKIFWIFVVMNVFVICGLQTTWLIQFWNEGNILVTKESASMKVWDIPFPALTICSENQINSTEMNIAAEKLQNSQNFTYLKDYVEKLCDASYLTGNQHRHNFTKNPGDDIYQYAFHNLVLDCERTILRVFWMTDELLLPCQYFQPIIMSTGVCYSLNMVLHRRLFNAQYHKILNNLLNYSSMTAKEFGGPWHVAGDMLSNSVTISINLRHKNFEQYCQITGNGVKIFVHNPTEHPLLSHYIYAAADKSYLIIITPNSVTTSDSLVKWKPAHRGCYYQTEKALRYFNIYTQSNCELECRINKTIARCGCLPFYLPRFRSTHICSMEEEKCVKESASTQFSIFSNKNFRTEAHNSDLKYCDCLPSCSELIYNTEMSETSTNWTHVHKVYANISEDFQSITVITLHFKKKSVDNWVRSPVLRFNELVANMGGIVSLYTGCSIVSLFEMMCFMILKKWLQNAASRSPQQQQQRQWLASRRRSFTMVRSNHVKPTSLNLKKRF